MPDEVRKVVSTHKNGDRNEVGMYWTDKPIISDSSITGRKMCTNNIASSMYAKFFLELIVGRSGQSLEFLSLTKIVQKLKHCERSKTKALEIMKLETERDVSNYH